MSARSGRSKIVRALAVSPLVLAGLWFQTSASAHEPSEQCAAGFVPGVIDGAPDGFGGRLTICVDGVGAIQGSGNFGGGGQFVLDPNSNNPVFPGFLGVDGTGETPTVMLAPCGDHHDGAGDPADADSLLAAVAAIASGEPCEAPEPLPAPPTTLPEDLPVPTTLPEGEPPLPTTTLPPTTTTTLPALPSENPESHEPSAQCGAVPDLDPTDGDVQVCVPGSGAVSGAFTGNTSGGSGYLVADGDSTNSPPLSGYAGVEGSSSEAPKAVFDSCGNYAPGQGQALSAEALEDATSPCTTTTTTTTTSTTTTTTTTSVPVTVPTIPPPAPVAQALPATGAAVAGVSAPRTVAKSSRALTLVSDDGAVPAPAIAGNETALAAEAQATPAPARLASADGFTDAGRVAAGLGAAILGTAAAALVLVWRRRLFV